MLVVEVVPGLLRAGCSPAPALGWELGELLSVACLPERGDQGQAKELTQSEVHCRLCAEALGRTSQVLIGLRRPRGSEQTGWGLLSLTVFNSKEELRKWHC